MHVVEQEFVKFMNQFTKENTTKTFNIAYSGGVDSEVLLFLFSKYFKEKTQALHVNHGISNNAKTWENSCLNKACNYGVDIKVAHFHLAEEKSNLEEKARELRYKFFEDNMSKESVLVTGHHMDDQAETFLMRLMRGSGVDGLSSMRPIRPFATGLFIRPFLTVTKEDLYDFAKQHDLTWVEDESNKDCHYDRNFIRNKVMPLLKTRWSNASTAISRTAKHCQNASEELNKTTTSKLDEVSLENGNLDKEKFIQLSSIEKDNVLRLWIQNKANVTLEHKNIKTIISEVINSKDDSKAEYNNKTFFIRKYRNEIYYIDKTKETKFKVKNAGEISSHNFDDMKKEKIVINNKKVKLKVILKEMNIPSWERNDLTVFTHNNEIVAVGDMLRSDNCPTELIVERIVK